MATAVGHNLAKVLGIKIPYRNPTGDSTTRGESVYSVSSADTYIEKEPTAAEWIREITPTGGTFLRWAYHLFPFTHWIGRYNLQWLAGDLVAGTDLYSPVSYHLAKFQIRHHGWLRRRPPVYGLRSPG